MDDGVILYAEVAYPTDLATGERAAEQFPVVLTHTPYVGELNTYFTEYGYISVKVSARGGCSNAGGNVGYYDQRDAHDGKCVIEWASRLAGSDGTVGQFGFSYAGGLSLGDAAFVGENSPLKATVAQGTGLNPIPEGYLPGGIPSQSVAATGGLGAMLGGNAKSTAFFQNLAADTFAGGETAYLGSFWNQRLRLDWSERIVANGVPVLLWSGWDDVYSASALQTYSALQNAAQGRSIYAPMDAEQPVTPRYQIVHGNWGHGDGLDDGVVLQWFDTWIKGIDTGLQTTDAPMHLFEEGSNRWVNTSTYPATDEYTSFYACASDALGTVPAEGETSQVLAWAQPTDPHGLLSFTTSAFPRGATLAGPMNVTAHVSSSNTNLVLIANLWDVAPDGTEQQITKGVVLGSQSQQNFSLVWKDKNGEIIRSAALQDEDRFLTPNKVYQVEIPLWPAQWGLAEGHRLRLAFTTQTPADVCAAGLGTDPSVLTVPQEASIPGATYTILHGANFPTRVNVPLLGSHHFGAAASGVTPTSNGYVQPLDWGTASGVSAP